MITARTALAALLSGSLLVACGGGGGIGNIIGGLSPTPAPTSAPTTSVGYSCPSSINGTSTARMAASFA
ncbi:MAG: peptidase S8, partial [Candidatus Baltobacteraceae bacterium]